MDMLFLGSSSGTPTKTRNVTGLALLEDQGSSWCLIDCGEGTQHQLLHTPLSAQRLAAVFITHVHGDHCYGLPGLLASAGMNGRKEALHVVAPAGIREWLEATMQHTALQLPFELHFHATESLKNYRVGDLVVDAIALSHRVPSYAYGFTEARTEAGLDTARLTADGIPQGPLWGKLQRGTDIEYLGRQVKSADYLEPARKPRKIVIGGDNDRPALLQEACRDCDVLVHEATYTADIALKVGDVGHSSAQQVARFAASAQIPNLVLTHFSPRYQAGTGQSPSIQDIHAEARAAYSGELFLAEDFARYRLDRKGAFRLLDGST